MDKQYVQAGVLSTLTNSLAKMFNIPIKPIHDWQTWMKSLQSPIKGFDTEDGDVKLDESTGVISSHVLLVADTTNNGWVKVDITLSATNVKQTYIGKIMDVLLNQDENSDKDITEIAKLELVTNDQDGILQVKLNPKEELPRTWKDIATQLEFSLKCQSPGKDEGTIQGQDLATCCKLVGEYMVKTGLTEFVGEVKLDAKTFVFPILCQIQQWLYKYCVKAGLIDATSSNDGQPTDSQDNETDADANTSDTTLNSNTRIKVTLQKINGSTELLALDTDYSAGITLDYLDELCNDENFNSAITTDPLTFDIVPTDDEFVVNIDDDVLVAMPEDSLTNLFSHAICLYRNLYMIHWLSYGNDMEKLHLLAEELYTELIKQVDVIGELLVEKTGTIPNIHQIGDTFDIRNYTFQDGLCVLTNMLQEFIDVIDITYPNQTSDVQSILDDWLRYWTKQLNYFIQRQIS